MSKTKTVPNNDLADAPEKPRDYEPPPSDAVKETQEIAKAAETSKPEKKPRGKASMNLQIASKIDLELQKAAKDKPGADIAILEFLAKDRGWALMYTGSADEVFDRR